jgi:hypothetical protein
MNIFKIENEPMAKNAESWERGKKKETLEKMYHMLALEGYLHWLECAKVLEGRLHGLECAKAQDAECKNMRQLERV